ncbi:hypothetical protein A6E19_08405 [Pseudomonas putida]|nr:hypothetical protein A6E24_19415 [Pseudomonas putida]OCT29214.1 hypothetical protein A6E23_06280 [Pseudomonas putida]OCT35450.1 hypothetical protein A6E20_19910 [Pseudomonas putida]OCT39564.1 hypothetical protein A6E19_08405 [Pseudomonas putida]
MQNGTSLLLSKALGQGGSASDALKSALFNTLAAASFNAVGDYTKQFGIENGSLPKIAIHAMVGGLLSKATGGDFRTGALAAGANEALVVQLNKLVGGNENLLTMSSQIVGVLAAASQEDADASSLNKAAWVAKNGTQYNILGDHSAKQRDEARDNYRKDGGMDAARELVNLEGADQRSDKLLQVYKRDPSLLSQDDKVELAAYLQVYAFERLDAVRKVDAQNGLGISHSLATVQASVASLLSGEQTLGYGYPYAGSSQDKLAWADAQRSQMGLVENLTWTRDRSVDEQTYLDAKSSLRIGEQQQGLANLGDPAIYFLTGSIGSTIRAVAATNGALQFTQGAKQAVDGDGWNAAGNMVAGLLGMATLGIPAIKGGAGPVVVADSKVAGGAKATGAAEVPATSAIARVGLRDDLAAQAGIPRNIAESPSSMWGKSIDDIKQSLTLDGASVTPKAPLAGTSGKAQVFSVEGHPAIKEVEFHPGGGTHGDSPYYKIISTAKIGNKNIEIRVIDPSPDFSPGTITRYQQYYDTHGNRLKYEGGEWKGWK